MEKNKYQINKTKTAFIIKKAYKDNIDFSIKSYIFLIYEIVVVFHIFLSMRNGYYNIDYY